MTWFLKSKILRVRKQLIKTQNEFQVLLNRYNMLVQEFNTRDSFELIGVPQQQAPPMQQEFSQRPVSDHLDHNSASTKSDSQLDKRTDWSEEKRRAFAEKMRIARETKKAEKEAEKNKKDAEGLEI